MLIPLLVVAAAVAQGFGRFGYALLLPAVEADLVHSYAVAGLLGTLNLAAYLAGTLVVSLTAHRPGAGRLRAHRAAARRPRVCPCSRSPPRSRCWSWAWS